MQENSKKKAGIKCRRHAFGISWVKLIYIRINGWKNKIYLHPRHKSG